MKLALVDTFEERGSTSPLGLLSIATYLRRWGYGDTTIFDVAFDDPLKKIGEVKPDLIGISAYTIKYNYAVSLANKIKRVLDVPVFVGGSHISLAPYSLNKVFDFGVLGEGEKTMLRVMQALDFGLTLKVIKGLVLHDGKITGSREPINPLDLIPIPDRSLANPHYFDKIKSFKGKWLIEGNLLTSRGCPYKCPFCASSLFWGKLRFNSVERVVNEVQYLREKFKVNCVNVWDDFFTVSKKRVQSVGEALKTEGLTENIEFRVQVRVNTFNREMAKLLKVMNVTNLNFGFESGSQNMLNQIKRGVTVKQIKKVVKLGKKFGFQVTGSLIFGMPHETLEDMKLTLKLIDFLHEAGADKIWFFVAIPYPSTDWFNYAKKLGTVSENMDWSVLDLRKYDNVFLLDSNVDRNEFKKVLRIAENKVRAYFRIHAKNRSVFYKFFWGLKHPRRSYEAFKTYCSRRT